MPLSWIQKHGDRVRKFCAKCNSDTVREVRMDRSGEFILTCGNCHSFLKFSANHPEDWAVELKAMGEEVRKFNNLQAKVRGCCG